MKTFQCKFCGKDFEKKQSLGGHVIRCKDNPNPTGSSGFVKYNDDLRNLKRTRPEHEHKDRTCEVCGKIFSQKGIGSHMWRAHGEGQKLKPFKGQHTSPWNKGKNKSEDPRIAKGAETLSKNTKGRVSTQVWTEEMREKQSKRKKELHEIHPEKHPNRILAKNRKYWTYPEKVTAKWLEDRGISFVKNMKVDRFYPDFIIENLIIEIDGERWHNEQSDKERDEKLTSSGYSVIRIKAKEAIEKRLEEIFEMSK